MQTGSPSQSAISPKRLAVAVSGSGRSLANFIEQQAKHQYEVAAVIASRPDCYAVTIARQHKLPVFIERFNPETIDAVGAKLYPWLAQHGIAWVALAGFLKLFPLQVDWQRRVVNIHPALLPKFGGHSMYGERVHAAVIAAGETHSGATVHWVNERYDEGQIIAQVTVPVQQGDDAETLAARVFSAEKAFYPMVMDRLIAGSLPLAASEIYRTHIDTASGMQVGL